MTTISASIVLDSISRAGKRIVTVELTYPRFIHSELMTHRDFSRNAASSRAIPVKRMIGDIRKNPAIPLFWGKNQKGMQALEECNELVHISSLTATEACRREDAWIKAMDSALSFAESFDAAGYHKQVVNRLIEPYMHMRTLVTATEWDNFFTLRNHKDAEPHFELLAKKILEAMENSTPKLLDVGEWHLPYITDEDWALFPPDLIDGGDGYSYNEALVQVIKISVARCARVSYFDFDGLKPSPLKDEELYSKLIVSKPMHASPIEHQAMAMSSILPSRNFRGWKQYREIIESELWQNLQSS